MDNPHVIAHDTVTPQNSAPDRASLTDSGLNQSGAELTA